MSAQISSHELRLLSVRMHMVEAIHHMEQAAELSIRSEHRGVYDLGMALREGAQHLNLRLKTVEKALDL